MSVDDLLELIHYHVVLGEPADWQDQLARIAAECYGWLGAVTVELGTLDLAR